ncbi:MAG: hypothetical protein WC273_12615 [Dehalococcoidia bacterium]
MSPYPVVKGPLQPRQTLCTGWDAAVEDARAALRSRDRSQISEHVRRAIRA